MHLAGEEFILYAFAIKNIDNSILKKEKAMRDKPVILGLETEYGISVYNASETDTLFAPYDVVKAVNDLNIPLIDRGLESIDTIEEHEKMEAEARQRLFEYKYENRVAILRKASRALRQRLGCSGYMLETGARYYVDMQHPEYSTPETEDPRTIVLVQKAGDFIVEECRKRAEHRMRVRTGNRDLAIHIHRNNSDGKGNSYAGHENYSLSPNLFDEIMYSSDHFEASNTFRGSSVIQSITNTVLKFLVTRSIIIGSGKVGFEEYEPASYQISQRADFMMQPIAASTVYYRGIINTRNDPLARYRLIRRFHTICGDSNMSELSIYLKCGITALFFKMLEQGYIQNSSGNLMTGLRNSVSAMHAVSRDLTLRQKLPLADTTFTTALQTQEEYCELAKSYVEKNQLAPVWTDVAEKWEAVLNGLNGDRLSDPWASSLDWVAKERFLKQYQKQHHIDNPVDINCQAIALAYHNTNPDRSIYERLLNNGRIKRIVSSKEINSMIHEPPVDTRAYLRGKLIQQYASHITDIGWDYVVFTNNTVLQMNHPRKGTKDQIEPLLADHPSFEIFLERISHLFTTEPLEMSHNRWIDNIGDID